MVRACSVGLLLLLVAGAHGLKTKVTPVEKVIDLLKGLSAQTTEQGKVEAKQYDDFSCFCKEQADEKLYNIEKSEAKLEKLAAQIAKLEGEIAQLNSDISDLSKQMSSLETEIEAISDERAKQHSAYLVEAKDMSDAIAAIQGAIKALKDSKDGQSGDVKKSAFVQVKAMVATVLELSVRSTSLTPTDKELSILSMLRDEAPGQPHGYSFHSNDIIATLEGLQKTFKENKADLDEAEFKVRAAFEKKKLGLQNEHKFAGMEKDEKSALEASKSDELSGAQEDEAEETHAKNCDNDFMKVLTDQCEAKAEQFDQRSKMRSDELTALADALGALEEGVQPNYSANSKLTGLVQESKQPVVRGHWEFVQGKAAPSFLQVRESSSDVSLRVVKVLQGAAGRLTSPVLSAAVLKVKVGLAEDHFVKVRGLIKDLIAKLKADAEAEAESKSFCDKGMSKAIAARDEAKMTIEEKTADISKNEAEKAGLKQDIEDLNKAISENMKALNEATEMRAKENAANDKTLAEADAGKDAVTFALTTLKEFYEGAVLLQKSGYTPPNVDRDGNTMSDLAPAGPEGTYHGNQGASKGIIGLLEVILSDFERTLKTTADTEADAQAKFDKYEKETNDENKSMNDDIDKKTNRVSAIDDTLATLADENVDAKEMLDGALASLEKLKPMCVDGTETYAERVAKREQEIAALKEAMQILIDWQGF